MPCGFRLQEIWYTHILGQGVHKLSADWAGYPAKGPCSAYLRRMWVFDDKSLVLTWAPCSIMYLARQPFLFPNTNSLLILQFPDELGRRYFAETCQDGRSSGMSITTALVRGGMQTLVCGLPESAADFSFGLGHLKFANVSAGH